MCFRLICRYLLVPVGSSIKVIEVESASTVRMLTPVTLSEITQILTNPLKPDCQVISCSVDGSLNVWDWKTGDHVKGFRTKHAMHSMMIKSFDASKGTIDLLIVSLRLKGPLGCNLPDPRKLFNYCAQRTTSLIELVKLEVSNGAFKTRQVFKARGLTRLAMSPSGDEMVFNSREEIRFCKFGADDEFTVHRTIKHTSAITRLQYHPKEPCLVLSDRHGQIVMWYCLDPSGTPGVQRTLHWHANEVTDLAFTSNGQYLLSGGEEAVMVLWQIESGLRQYLPRLGDPIHFISVSSDDRWVAVSTRDNVIHLVSLTSGSTLTVSKSIRGCILNAGASLIKTSTGASTVLLPGNPGTLQVYDPVKDCVETVLEVAPQNRPTGFGASQKPRKVLEIVKTAVSPCGKWMATLEQRNSHKTHKTILTARLKFWGRQSSTWTLLSSVERPHADLVTDLALWIDSETGVPRAASSSKDGTFKLWHINLEHGIWTCFHVGSYHDNIGGAVSLSVDVEGKCLAVVYGAAVTLWRLKDVCLVEVLMTTQTAKLSEARFLRDGSIVACCREEGTFVFNRLAGKLVLSWHAPVSPKAPLAIHPSQSQFAMIVDTPSGDHMGVLTYASESPVPIGFYMMPEQCADFKAAVFVPSPESVRKVRPGTVESHILVLFDARTGEFVLLGTENASLLNRSDFKHRIKPAQLAPETSKTANSDRVKSLYRAIFDSSDGLTQNASLDSKAGEIKHSMADLFTAIPQISSDDVLLPLVASHVLPPVSMLFSNYIQKLLKKRN